MHKLIDLREDLSEDISILSKNDIKNLQNTWSVFPSMKNNMSFDTIGNDKTTTIDISIAENYRVYPKLKISSDTVAAKKLFFSKKDTINISKEKSIQSKLQNFKLNNKKKNPFQKRYLHASGLKNFFSDLSLSDIKKLFLGDNKEKFFTKNMVIGIVLIALSISGMTTFLNAKAGYTNLQSLAQGSGSTKNLQKTINDARFNFMIADFFGKPFYLVPGKHFQSARHLIKGGKNLTSGADELLALYEININALNLEDLKKIEISSVLSLSKDKLELVHKNLSKAQEHYDKVSVLENTEFNESFTSAKSKLTKGNQFLEYALDNYEAIEIMLGNKQEKKYLLIFQNNDEIRPMGGFMGSMAVLSVYKGAVKDFKKKDVYAFEWDLKSVDYQKEPAPKGIDQLTEYFGLRDSNYFVTTRESSENIRGFINKTGLEIDGIIYINQKLILDMLDETGGVYMESIGQEINANNFSRLMSVLVEAKLFKVGTLGTPKQILFDFIEDYKTKLLVDRNFSQYLGVAIDNILSRDIAIYSFDPEVQDFLRGIKLDGDFYTAETIDFTYPVFTSLSGNKSDRYMNRSFHQKIEKSSACNYDVTFSIKQEHTFDNSELSTLRSEISRYNIDSENLEQIQGNAPNKQYVRVLIPKNSIVEVTNGIDVINYNRWKSVELFTLVEPGTTQVSSFKYKLINPECKPYNYHFIKQPGILNYNLRYDYIGDKKNFINFSKDLWIPESYRPEINFKKN